MSEQGNVFEGEIRSGVYGVRVCAIKLARKSEHNVREAGILTKLASHTHVISIIDSGIFEDMFEDRVFIALDKCHKDNLHHHITHRKKSGLEFDLNKVLEYCKQIIVGIKYVHENLIIHMDLKPSNILLSHDKSTIKIADFGLSQEIKSTSSKIYCKHQFGTNGFRPLESLGNSWASLKSDIFSLGALFYFLLSNGRSVFGDEITLWLHNMIHGIIDLSHLKVSNAKTFHHLIELMLNQERCRRPSIWEVDVHPCWNGSDVECNFDYGCAEEIDDCDAGIPDSSEIGNDKNYTPDLNNDNENLHEFLRDLSGIGVYPILEPSIIIFDGASKHLHSWNPKDKSVKQMHEFNDEMKSRRSFSTVSNEQYIYVLMKDSMYRLDYSDDKAPWERLENPISNHGFKPPAVKTSDAIYVAGSGGFGPFTKAVSKYDCSAKEWEVLKQKHLATNWATTVELNGYVYSIGGDAEGIGSTSRVERLNVASHTWDDVATMHEARVGPSVVVFNGHIIAAGGVYGAREAASKDRPYRALNSVEKFDPASNQWTIMNPMKEGRAYFWCHLIEGKIYAVGGDVRRGSIEKYETYNKSSETSDDHKDEWLVFDALSLDICCSALAKIKN